MSRRKGQEGFTLLELAIVLAILGVITMLATREIGSLQDQQRFDGSQRGLEAIREAIWGSPDDRAPDGTGLRAGFAGDMGRLPESVEELWTNRVSLDGFDVRAAADDGEVKVPGGWRGPYVRLPLGTNALRDGWGRAYTNEASPDLWRVGHLGGDGKEGGTGYNQDVFAEFGQAGTRAWGWGQVRVVDPNSVNGGGAEVRVRMYYYDPDAGGGVGKREISAVVDPATCVAAWSNAVAEPVPTGVRAVRAELAGTGKKSAIRYVSLRPGWNGPIVLEIP